MRKFTPFRSPLCTSLSHFFPSRAHFRVVEFQKRGKPHAHIVMRLVGDDSDMPRSAEAVDRCISVNLPEVDAGGGCVCSVCVEGEQGECVETQGECVQSRALKAVKKHMIHSCAVGVCTTAEAPGVCKRGFPKGPCVQTHYDDGGYPTYTRKLGSEFVVAHNVFMVLKYDCHINLETSTSVWVHKYMVS